MGYWHQSTNFFRENWRNYQMTGSVLPSSRFLARAMAANLGKPREPARILEAGPGTGPVTRAILDHLQPGDQLDIVEINSTFVEILRGRFKEEEPFRGLREQANILHQPVEEISGRHVYDFIISSLPFANFPPDLVRSVLRSYRRLLKPTGTLTYFEYAWLRRLKVNVAPAKTRRRLARVSRVVDKYVSEHQIKEDLVLVNFPPAIVRHMRFAAAEGE